LQISTFEHAALDVKTLADRNERDLMDLPHIRCSLSGV
jgi:hypothetical protein